MKHTRPTRSLRAAPPQFITRVTKPKGKYVDKMGVIWTKLGHLLYGEAREHENARKQPETSGNNATPPQSTTFSSETLPNRLFLLRRAQTA